MARTDAQELHEEGRNLPMLIGLILVSVTLAAVAQLTLKHGMNQVGALKVSGDSVRAVLTTPSVWLGLVLFGFSAILWLYVLSHVPLSFAYPFVSLTYVLILLFDKFVLHQEIQPLRWLGVALIMAGIVLVAQTPHG